MDPISEACRLSESKVFIGSECIVKKFLDRINRISEIFCDMEKRLRLARSDLYRYCNPPSSSSSQSSSSSSSWDCPVIDPEPPIPNLQFLVSPNDLDQAAYDSLASLESEVCATLRKIMLFQELVKIPCGSSSSSSGFDSGSSSPSSHSDSFSESSLGSQSSSSLVEPSSSSSAELECASNVKIASFCDSIPNYDMFAIETDIGFGPCAYSSNAPGSSSSSGGEYYRLRYNLTLNRWEITDSLGVVIAIREFGTVKNPRGVYEFISGPCIGESIFVV